VDGEDRHRHVLDERLEVAPLGLAIEPRRAEPLQDIVEGGLELGERRPELADENDCWKSS
jgi:hypothetical protein